MILNDRYIRNLIENGEIGCDPLPEDIQYQPASLDVRLGDTYIVNKKLSIATEKKPIRIPPNTLILGTTLETFEIPASLVARLEGRSSYARKGLLVHVTAGFIDPGFKGQITLEMYNISKSAISIPVGARVAQLVFEQMIEEPIRAYGDPDLGSQYQDQQDATASRLL